MVIGAKDRTAAYVMPALNAPIHRRSNVLLPDTLSPRECAEFVQMALTMPPVCADMGQDQEFPEQRSSVVRWIYKNYSPFTWIFDRIMPLVFSNNMSFFGVNIEDIDSLQFTEYHSNRLGRYDFHVDTVWESAAYKDRKLSFVVQLSDPSSYVGGELQIHCHSHPDPTILRQQGAMVIFSSMLEHAVLPVTCGFRFSLVGWASGPRFV